jgi:hypothetical protein
LHESVKVKVCYAVLVTSQADLPMDRVVDPYDGRAAIEADLKSGQYGLGLVTIRKCKQAAQLLPGLVPPAPDESGRRH